MKPTAFEVLFDSSLMCKKKLEATFDKISAPNFSIICNADSVGLREGYLATVHLQTEQAKTLTDVPQVSLHHGSGL